MEVWLIVNAILGTVAGIMVGYHLSKRASRTKPIGTLRVDTSDPEGPYLFLELDADISTVYKSKQVTLEVDTSNYISQK